MLPEHIELQIEVAKALGWRDIVILNSIIEGDVVIGYPPGDGVRCRVPNWLKDLPACMAPGGPWEWLEAHTSALDSLGWQTKKGRRTYLRYVLNRVPASEIQAFYQEITPAEDSLAPAIYHAVLAIVEKLGEQNNV